MVLRAGCEANVQSGPSLMPDAIDTYFSRGHPLLFYATAAAWMKLFGISHTAQHAFSLTISCLTLVSIYEVCLAIFNKRIAVINLLLVATQVIFFVQSILLLPEIMVAILLLLSIYFYTAPKYLLTFLCLSALMLTKESGAVAGLVLGFHAFYCLFRKDILTDKRIKRFISIAGAGVVVLSFFLLQRKLNGWFFYPEHLAYINMDWLMFKGKLRFFAEILFAQQSRGYYFTFLAFLSLTAGILKKDFRLLLPLFLYILLYLFTYEYMLYITLIFFYPFDVRGNHVHPLPNDTIQKRWPETDNIYLDNCCLPYCLFNVLLHQFLYRLVPADSPYSYNDLVCLYYQHAHCCIKTSSLLCHNINDSSWRRYGFPA